MCLALCPQLPALPQKRVLWGLVGCPAAVRCLSAAARPVMCTLAIRFFRQEEVWGSHSQRRVWTSGDSSKPCCVPHYSSPQLCPCPGQLKDEEPRDIASQLTSCHQLLSYKKLTFQDFWNMLSKPRENCTSETHTDMRRLSAHTLCSTNSVLSSQTIRLTVCHSVSSCCLLLKT